MNHTHTASAPASSRPAAPAARMAQHIDVTATSAANDLRRQTDGTFRSWRIHQGTVYASSHRAETWLADLRLDTRPGPDGLMEATGSPRIGSHATWRVRVPSVTVLVARLRDLEHQVRASYAAAARFREETGRPPYTGIDDRRMDTLRAEAAGGTFDLPF